MDVKRRQRRKSGSAAVYIPVAVLVIVFMWVFGTSVFFKVTGFEVTGAGLYTEEEIINASGIVLGDNLLLIDVNAAVIKLKSELPYIEDIRLQRSYPDKVVISVKESSAVAVISAQGSDWVIDLSGRILEKPVVKPAGLVSIEGITPAGPAVGQIISVSEAEKPRLDSMKTILSAVSEAGLLRGVSKLNVTNITNVSLVYQGRFTVALGSADNMSYKLDMMLDVINKLPDSGRAVGTILLASDNPRFIPQQ